MPFRTVACSYEFLFKSEIKTFTTKAHNHTLNYVREYDPTESLTQLRVKLRAFAQKFLISDLNKSS